MKFYWSKIRSTLLFRSQASLAKEGLVELDAEVSTLSKTDVMLSFTIEGKLMLFLINKFFWLTATNTIFLLI